jgi:hypothetical protein
MNSFFMVLDLVTLAVCIPVIVWKATKNRRASDVSRPS